MKNKQIIAILLVFATVLTVFCSCKAKETELIPDTPEITFSTDSKESDPDKPTVMISEPGSENTDDTPIISTSKKEENGTTKKASDTTAKTDAKETSSKTPDNSVETKPKTTATTAKQTTTRPTATKQTTTEKATTTKPSASGNSGNSVSPSTTKPATTETTTEHTTKKSTATILPVSAKLTYLNDPKNSFLSKLTYKDLEGYGLSEADKSAFLSDRSGWEEYTIRIDLKNNDEKGSATIYYLSVDGNGTNGVFVNGDPRGEMSIAPGGSSYILFNVLVKDSSMIETIVLKTVSEMKLRIKYAATPENDSDLPNYKYVDVE